MPHHQNPLCHRRKIEEIRKRFGFAFSKSLSQNFLIDPDIPEEMAAAAELNEQTGVLEIGPGIGALTWSLAKRAEKVVALEADPSLPPILSETLAEFKNVEILPGDALKWNFDALCEEKFGSRRVLLCANLPYHITTEVVEKLLQSKRISAAFLMIQKEAAERFCAKPGDKAASEISYHIAYHFEAKICFLVPRDRFQPPPHVDSAVISLVRKDISAVKPKEEEIMFSLISAAFQKRRKTISNALSGFKGLTKDALSFAMEQAEISPSIRGERLTLEDYQKLAEAIKNQLENGKTKEN